MKQRQLLTEHQCPRCGKRLKMLVLLTLEVPLKLEGRMTKRTLQRRDVRIVAGEVSRSRVVCGCGWSE